MIHVQELRIGTEGAVEDLKDRTLYLRYQRAARTTMNQLLSQSEDFWLDWVLLGAHEGV